VTNIGKAGQYRGVKLLKQEPITDHVLDIIGHHGEHGGAKKETEIAVVQSGERERFRRTGGTVHWERQDVNDPTVEGLMLVCRK
jgi:hypothetical protein